MGNMRKKSGKYLKTIYLWLCVLFMTAQVAFSMSILVKTNEHEIENNYETNKQIFQQAAYNIKESDETIRNICKELFVNPQIVRNMYGTMQDDNLYEWIREFQQICGPIMMGNPEVKSVYVYNRPMNQFFSSYRYLNFQDEQMRELLAGDAKKILMKPFVRDIEDAANAKRKSRVLTYAIFDTLDSVGLPEGAIVVNVDFNRFYDEIHKLITFSKEEKSQILIFNGLENIALDQKGEQESELVRTVKNSLEEINASDDSDKNFVLKTEKIGGEKYGIFFTKIPSMDWTVVKVQSYEEVFSSLQKQKIMILVQSAIFCVVMLLLTYAAARKIYAPIGQLVSKVKGNRPGEENDGNEIQYLNRTYENLFQKAREYQRKTSGGHRKVVLDYNLRSLLIDGRETDETVLETLQEADKILFDRGNTFGISILQIDDYEKFREKHSADDQELYKYAIENILSEILQENGYQNAVFAVTEDKLAVLVRVENETDYKEDMENSFRLAVENMKKYFQITFTSAIGACRNGIEQIHDLYIQVENRIAYRYILGKEAVIPYDYRPVSNVQTDVDALMENLNRHIQAGNAEEICTDFRRLTETAKGQDCSELAGFLTDRIIQILYMIEAKEHSKGGSRTNLILAHYSKMLSMETWEEMAECLRKLLADTIVVEDKQTQKTKLLVNTIVKIVEEEYEDSNLCVQQIADMVKMSSQYMGRVFKGSMGLSVSDFINEYRLNKSVQIMTETGCTVSEVLEKVGIENESQYYRLFKKKYGTTPKAYILELLSGDEER